MRTQMGTETSSELGSREAVEVEETVKTLLASDEVRRTRTAHRSFNARGTFRSAPSRHSVRLGIRMESERPRAVQYGQSAGSTRAVSTFSHRHSFMFSAGEPRRWTKIPRRRNSLGAGGDHLRGPVRDLPLASAVCLRHSCQDLTCTLFEARCDTGERWHRSCASEKETCWTANSRIIAHTHTQLGIQ